MFEFCFSDQELWYTLRSTQFHPPLFPAIHYISGIYLIVSSTFVDFNRPSLPFFNIPIRSVFSISSSILSDSPRAFPTFVPHASLSSDLPQSSVSRDSFDSLDLNHLRVHSMMTQDVPLDRVWLLWLREIKRRVVLGVTIKVIRKWELTKQKIRKLYKIWEERKGINVSLWMSLTKRLE
jgi:hypothetical protein